MSYTPMLYPKEIYIHTFKCISDTYIFMCDDISSVQSSPYSWLSPPLYLKPLFIPGNDSKLDIPILGTFCLSLCLQGGKDANLGATIWIPLTVTPYGDRLEPKANDYVPDVVIQNVLELNDLFLAKSANGDNDDNEDARPGNPAIDGIRSNVTRPFRSLSTGNAGQVVTTALDEENGTRCLDKTRRRFAVSLLADMDSCSSSSSSADFS